MKNTSLPVIFTGDPGTDDAIALAVASVFMKENLKGFMASFGNIKEETSFRNMRDLTELLGFDAPVFPTSSRPILCDPLPITDYHGLNGLGDVILPTSSKTAPEGDSFENVAKLIRELGRVIIASVGPLTDIATLFTRFPETKECIDRIVLMGGGFEVFNVDHNTEYNFYTDPDAVNIVIRSGVPIVFAPLDITMQTALSEEDLCHILRQDIHSEFGNDDYGSFAKILIANYDTGMRHGCGGGILHDVLVFLYLCRPELFTVSERCVDCDKYGSVFFSDSGCKSVIMETVDQSEFIKTLCTTFDELRK